MKIIECYIENFGKISDKRFEFKDGFNTILAENGYGKTTLSVFIKCMLYGMNDTRKISLDENERKRYLPWSGAACSGSMTISVKDRLYRIERSFAPKAADDTFKLFDVSLGRECNDFSENLGEELLGIDADGFERTLYLSEKNLSPKNDNRTISAKLSELVGCDGDISSMGDALKLLEEQRKFYVKKGGSGEISDLRLEISELEEKLGNIAESEMRLVDTEKALEALGKEETALRDEEAKLVNEREALAKLSSEQSYKITLENMKKSLSEAEAKRDELIELFCGSVPTEAAVERAKALEEEIKRLRAATADEESAELKYLKNCFEKTTSPEKAEEMKLCLDRVKKGAYEDSPEVKRCKEVFTKRRPSEGEVREHLNALEAKDGLNILPLAIGVLLVALGVALGIILSPILFALSAFGIAPMALPFVLKSKKEAKKRRELSDFYKSLSDTLVLDTRHDKEKLSEILSLLNVKDSGSEKEKDDTAKLRAYAELFGLGSRPMADVEQILAQYEKYKELLAVERYKEQTRTRAEYELREREKELSSFIGGFKFKSENPIEEIRAGLKEYTRLQDLIVAKRTDIVNLSSNHAVSNVDEATVCSAEEIKKRSEELSLRFSEISTKRALLERQYRLDTELIDSREELLAKKRELEEKLLKYNDNLETVKLTKKFLEAARESMTTKYLGKTRAGFDKYEKLITNGDGSFEMDTNFAISKIEGAKTHATEAYSRGMRDIYNIAARFALIDSLYEKEPPFVILDDPFAALDDEKCASALDILKKISEERQIIYFTCSSSRT